MKKAIQTCENCIWYSHLSGECKKNMTDDLHSMKHMTNNCTEYVEDEFSKEWERQEGSE